MSFRRFLAVPRRFGRPTPTARRVLITGGARSGKSQLAETMLASREQVVYLATGAVPTSDDLDWSARVAAHQARRPPSWTTVETSDAAAVLAAGSPAVLAARSTAVLAAGSPAVLAARSPAAPGARSPAAGPTPAVLFDCVGTWLTAAMDASGIWAVTATAAVTDDDPTIHDDAASHAEGVTATGAAAAADTALSVAVDGLVAAWAGTTAEVIAVTNEVGSGVIPATASGRRFRDELGRLNMRLAAVADEVWLCAAGIPLRLR